MNVAPYPLVGRSVEMVETEATSGNCTLISHLLNPVQDSEIATLLRHEGNSRNGILSSKSDSALDDNMDLQERNSHKDTTLPKPCRDDEQQDASSLQVSTVQVELNEGEGHKGKKRTIAFVTDDTTVGHKVGKESHVTGNAGSTFQGFSRVREARWRSTLYACLQNQRYESGEFQVKSANVDAFKIKVMKLNTEAIVIDPKTVRHSKCGKPLKMQTPYHLANFKSHVAKCKGPPKSFKMPGGSMMHINQILNQQ